MWKTILCALALTAALTAPAMAENELWSTDGTGESLGYSAAIGAVAGLGFSTYLFHYDYTEYYTEEYKKKDPYVRGNPKYRKERLGIGLTFGAGIGGAAGAILAMHEDETSELDRPGVIEHMFVGMLGGVLGTYAGEYMNSQMFLVPEHNGAKVVFVMPF